MGWLHSSTTYQEQLRRVDQLTRVLDGRHSNLGVVSCSRLTREHAKGTVEVTTGMGLTQVLVDTIIGSKLFAEVQNATSTSLIM